MIFSNLQPRIDKAMQLSDETNIGQLVFIIYDEITDPDSMNPAFQYLFCKHRPFTTRFDEYRFVLIIHPKN